MDEQVKDLINKIVALVRDALEEEIGVYQLEDVLKELIPAHITNFVARSCDLTIRVLRGCERQEDSFVLRVRVEEKTGERHEKIERAERAVLALYQSVKDALEHRAEFLFQAKAQTFERFANSLISQYAMRLTGKIEEILTASEEDSLRILELIKASVEVKSEPLHITEDVFLFRKEIEIEAEEIDITQTIEKSRSFFGGTTYEKIKVGTEFYQKLTVPSFDKMAEEWSRGAEAGKQRLWQVLREWILSYMEKLRKTTQELVKKALDFSMDELNRQRKLVDKSFNQPVAIVEGLENRKNTIESLVQTLSRLGSDHDG